MSRPPDFTLSRSLFSHTQMRGFHFPFATIAVLLSILSSPPTNSPRIPFVLSAPVDVRSTYRVLRLYADQKLPPRASCNESTLFSPFFPNENIHFSG